MNFSKSYLGLEEVISELFRSTFTASEGKDEGKLIGDLSSDLMQSDADKGLYVFTLWDKKEVAGAIIISSLQYPEDNRTVYLLAPVAIGPEYQRKGHGQRLIDFGLNDLKSNGVDIVITYGDPNYYQKLDFRQITTDYAQPPLKLNYPHGWQLKLLNERADGPLIGSSVCSDALNNPLYW